MDIFLKYDSQFIKNLENLIHKHVYIQKAPSLYLNMNHKRDKRLFILNIKKNIYKKRKSIFSKHGLKPYYNSKKEFIEHITLIKRKFKNNSV